MQYNWSKWETGIKISITFVFIMSTNAAKCTMILPLERRINAVIS